tara:strand:+ start:379 stop:1458 length:1080 start_codon:yes stop_codon:yes gene_type:complete
VNKGFIIDGNSLLPDFALSNSFPVSSSPKGYNVTLERSRFSKIFKTIYNEGDIVLIDENVLFLYPIDNVSKYVVTAIEENKNINTVLDFAKYMNDNNFNKKNKVIVVGGGITQDIGAFACSVFKRGVNWVLFPTTLLSMCDSCIGGKTGINFSNTKNQLGLFSSPSEVIICFDFLNTLESKDIKSGLGEVLKLYAMHNRDNIVFYDKVVKDGTVIDKKDYYEIIKRALLIKKSVVERDEFEFDIRKSLNYGHTLGHAIEVLSEYRIPHGAAVSIGMVLVNKYFGFNDELLDKKCKELFGAEDLNNIDYDLFENLVKKDKKTVGNETTFVTLKEYGNIEFVPKVVDARFMSKIKSIIEGL